MDLIKTVNIKKVDTNFDLVLCKVNTTPICEIPSDCIVEITRSLNEYDTISLQIPYYITDTITKEQKKNPIWDEIKEERLLYLNDDEYFVIKENKHSKDIKDKVVKAYSREYKMGKNDIKVEDIGFYLKGSEEVDGIYSLNDYMQKEIGWSFGQIDESVQYDIVEGVKIEKLRWQESISMRWYDFLVDNIAESFNCLVMFDTKNKLVHLYDINTVGEEIQIYLSMDNYLKDLEKSSNSGDIVTRLYIEGTEEMDIIGATATGYPYLENFSYFMEQEEMSSQLIHALLTYEARVIEHNIEWKRLASEKLSQSVILKSKQDEILIVYGKINGLKSILKNYDKEGDEEDRAIIIAQITELNDQVVILEVEIKRAEEQIKLLEEAIEAINILCKRETATDSGGYLIFDEILLNELKEFVYCETYTNDSFLREVDLVSAGERELDLKCQPEITYSVTAIDFTKRIADNGFRQHWNGDLSLGNLIILQDGDEEVLQYLIGFTIKPNDEESLTLTISNNKAKKENIRVVTDKLQEASRSMSTIKSKMYLWNQQKYNRLNLEKKQLVNY